MTKTLNKIGREVEGFSGLEARFGVYIRRKGVNKSFLIKNLRYWADTNYVSDKDLRVMVHQINNSFTWGDEDIPVPCNSKTALNVVLSELKENGEAFFGVIPGEGLLRGTWRGGCQGFTICSKKIVNKILSYKRESNALKYIQERLSYLDIDLSVLDN